jgi:antitoxin ParD1/3/4
MSKVQKVSIALTKELNTTVLTAVASGRYGSAGEVVREALRDWQAKQETPALSDDDLKRLWDEGDASGLSREFTIDKVKSEARAILEARKRHVSEEPCDSCVDQGAP